MTHRDTLEAVRQGPALFSGVPGDEVNLDALMAHLVARAFEGGVHLADPETEGLLWVCDGAPQEAWFFEAAGTEAVLGGEPGYDLIRDIAARGAVISVIAYAPPLHRAAAEFPLRSNAASEPAVPIASHPGAAAEAQAAAAATPGPAGQPADAIAPGAVPALTAETVFDVPAGSETAVHMEPPSHPWPAIMEEVAQRVARHRGAKLATRFVTALQAALTPHRGKVEEGRVIAPSLPESTWRSLVEAACAPIVAVAGRAFVDRTIAAAERDLATHAERAAAAGQGEHESPPPGETS